MRRVYVVDDEEPIRRSACLLLKIADFAPDAFDCGRDFIEAESSLDPGCVLLDIRMPDLDGIAVQRLLTERESSHATVIMTGHGDVGSAIAALEAGAVTFIEKPFSKAQLLPAIELALSRIERPEAYREQLRASREQVSSLADREQAILSMFAQGQSSDQIAVTLGLSPGANRHEPGSDPSRIRRREHSSGADDRVRGRARRQLRDNT